MACSQKHDIAIAFEKLGNLLTSGIPFLQAVDTVGRESSDAAVARAFADIHDRVAARTEAGGVLSEHGDVFPVSVQLLWKAGQKRDLPECCLRIAAILKTELMGSLPAGG